MLSFTEVKSSNTVSVVIPASEAINEAFEISFPSASGSE